MAYLGVDLGGTNIKAALTDSGGRILREVGCPTGLPRSAEAVCDSIVRLCRQLCRDADGTPEKIGGIGVGCPGTVEAASGVVRYSNNLAWHNFAMGPYLAAKTGLSVCLANDANAAAFGEAMAGCARGAESAVVITLGTGVGGGVVLGGRLLTGYTGAAAEPGHMVIAEGPGAPRCTCGRCGCLEAYASATALIRRTQTAMDAHPESLLHRLAAENGVSGRTAFDGQQAGDATASSVVDDYIHFLAVGVANLINLFFPEVVGLSGGVANQGEALLAPLRAAVGPMVFGHEFAEKTTRIVNCTLGYRAGMIGAALLAAAADAKR